MAPKWRHGSKMESLVTDSLSIKEVPESLAKRLRKRAAANHRSLQRELMAIVEAAAREGASGSGRSSMEVGRESLRVAEPEVAYRIAPVHADGTTPDGLLAELDAVVADSHWGEAPLLEREKLHDRALARELDLEARESELAAERARLGGPRRAAPRRR